MPIIPKSKQELFGIVINDASAKSPPVDADCVALMDTASSNILKKLTLTGLKAFLKTYFDTLYSGSGGVPDGDKGDITVSNGGTQWDIDPEAVTKADVGLANADNTADSAKPISTATQTALDGKSSTSHNHDGSYAAVSHTHAQSDVTNLVSDLAGKSAVGHTHTESDVTGLVSDLDALADAISGKQDTLVSATNIKTINGSSLLGAGDLVVSGSANIKQTEIDFGTTPVSEASFLITDADVSAGSQLIGSVAYEAPTGKDLDEMEMDTLDLKFAPGSGAFTLYARGLDGYIADKFRINYLVG